MAVLVPGSYQTPRCDDDDDDDDDDEHLVLLVARFVEDTGKAMTASPRDLPDGGSRQRSKSRTAWVR